MQVVGLTGSIAMGKSHAARMFERFGLPVFDSDAAVHALFRQRDFARCIAQHFGDVLATGGSVDRQKLGALVLGQGQKLKKLESLVHPAVGNAQRDFLRVCCRKRFARAVLDIPLLFETGHRQRFDAIISVICSEPLQSQRALARPGMSAGKLANIRAKQWPATRKAMHADLVIHSGFDRGATHAQVRHSLDVLDQMPANAWPQAWRS